MSISDAFRDRYYEPGYVYIAGSLSNRVLKIGTTKRIWRQQQYLRTKRYGTIRDWVLLYHVWVEQGGKTEHDARRRLRSARVLRFYEKDGRMQRGRELVRCDFSIGLEALRSCLSDAQRAEAWRSPHCGEFDFDVREAEARRLAASLAAVDPPGEQIAFNPAFLTKIQELELSVRTSNCLRNEGINYIGDLVQKTDGEMLRTPNFGRKSLNEIKEVLAQLGLHLGVIIAGWPPRDPELFASFVGTPFLRTVNELELSVRTSNCVKNEGIVFLGELVQKTEAEMLRVPNFGRKSLNEIKEVLSRLGLYLGMEVPGWPTGQV